jgi:hypothetical protein
MHCGECHRRFRWKDADFVSPCKGFHSTRRFPFVAKCPHSFIPRRHRCEYRARKAAALLPVGLVAAPIAVPLIVGAAVCKLPIWSYHHGRERVKARALQKRVRQARAEAARDVERLREIAVACRQSGKHDLIAGWCCNCGAIVSQSAPASASEAEASR